MKKLYFFFLATKKKKIQPRDRMNEWQCELLQEKKKHTKNTQKCGKKKTHPTFKKNKENPPDSE